MNTSPPVRVAIVCATHAPERFESHADLEVRLVAGRPERNAA